MAHGTNIIFDHAEYVLNFERSFSICYPMLRQYRGGAPPPGIPAPLPPLPQRGGGLRGGGSSDPDAPDTTSHMDERGLDRKGPRPPPPAPAVAAKAPKVRSTNDALGGPAEDVPDEVHEAMLAKLKEGSISKTSQAERALNIRHRTTFYGSPEYRDAAFYGYIHPTRTPVPAGMKWMKMTAGWKLRDLRVQQVATEKPATKPITEEVEKAAADVVSNLVVVDVISSQKKMDVNIEESLSRCNSLQALETTAMRPALAA